MALKLGDTPDKSAISGQTGHTTKDNHGQRRRKTHGAPYSSCRTGHRRVSDEIAVVTRGEAKFEGPPEAVPDALMRVGQAGVNRFASRQTDSLFLCVVTGVDRCAT